MMYLVTPESDDYIAIMAVLESSVTDLTPAEVTAALPGGEVVLDERTVETRLDKLREWTAVSARTDTSRILRHADLLARNWRYTATPAGRQVQRFYSTVLAGTPMMREIPLSSLARVVTALENMAADASLPAVEVAEHIGRLFTSHDDLDGALVGAEDTLAGLADRFDLDDDTTGELKRLLVDYATRVAGELESGAARASAALAALTSRFAELSAVAVEASDARTLIERGALTASRGGRVADWTGLAGWFDPYTGRAARFGLRLVRALPGMHANLRRLHSSSGTATSRARALQLAKAAADPTVGTAVLLAALGDHAWRKLYDDADDSDLPRNPSWRGGPPVSVPALLRTTGRTGARGRPPASRDDSAARAAVAAARARRATEHHAAVEEVLAARPGEQLSFLAADVALAALTAAVRAGVAGDRRTAIRDGLGCTVFHTGEGAGLLHAPTWRIWLPGRIMVFHRSGVRPPAPLGTTTEPDRVEAVSVEGAA